jgi:hypothetical protein
MRRFIAAAVGVALVATAAACGVPTDRGPVDVGQAPGFGADVQSPPVKLPEPDDASDVPGLVKGFLQAAAKGDWDPASGDQRITQAIEQARKFLTPTAARDWQPSGPVIVVESVPEPQVSESQIRFSLHGVGFLNADGVVEPLPTPLSANFTFTAEKSDAAGGRYRLTSVPPYLLLSTLGLRELYDVRPVYFWDQADRVLVPDRRYLSRGASRDKRIRAVVDRLLKGPSAFLDAVVNSLPNNTKSDSNPVVEGSKIVVDLSSAVSVSDKQLLRRIATQLRWSLHPEVLDLQLNIDGRPQGTFSDDSYLAYNPSASPAVDEADRLYVVAGGTVVQHSTGARVPPVLEAPENSYVVSAAVNGIRNSAAVVRAIGGMRELWIGRYGRETAAPRLVRVALPPTTVMSRPSYLPDVGNRVLVAAGDHVYDVADDGTFKQVQFSAPVGPVTAVAVAPDGSRLAFVARDGVYVTTINSATTPASVAQAPRQLYTGPMGKPLAVAWAYEHQLVVASATELMEVAIDSAHRAPIALPNLFAQKINQLASVPRTATSGEVRGPIVVDVDGRANYVFTSSGLRAVEMPGTATQSAAPRPSPSGSREPTPAQPVLSAPFYLDVG